MQDPTGWALWRPPASTQTFYIEGRVEAVPDDTPVSGGFYVHPFAGQEGRVIRGQAVLYQEDTCMPQILHASTQIYSDDSQADYLHNLSQVLAHMQATSTQKVVYSRRKKVGRFFSIEDSLHLFKKLSDAYPLAHVSLISIPDWGTWVAATPEVLCQKKGETYGTMALAGTRFAAKPTPWAPKEYQEQALVTEFVDETLQTLQATDIQKVGPLDTQAGTLRHLRTDFAFAGNFSLLQLAQALHPTPAIGGLPREAAATLIAQYETSPRGLYAGYLGYLPDDEGDATLYVHLRCALLKAPQPVLFAGGGILPTSSPQDEWEETEQKLNVLLPYLVGIQPSNPDN